jgi:uncharacterized protein (DUF58 family)
VAQDDSEQRQSRRNLAEAALGITVLGVIANIALTLWFGVHAAIGWRLLAALGIPLAFVFLVAVGSRRFNVAAAVTRAVTSHGTDPWSSDAEAQSASGDGRSSV